MLGNAFLFSFFFQNEGTLRRLVVFDKHTRHYAELFRVGRAYKLEISKDNALEDSNDD